MDLPKLLVLTCSCLACPLVGVGPYGWQCSLMESPCAVSLIVVDSFTMFTVRCCYVVNWVFCLLCGWIFHSVVCGTARHLYCWSEFYYVEFLLYRGVLCYMHYVCDCLFYQCGGVFCTAVCCHCLFATSLLGKVVGSPKLGWAYNCSGHVRVSLKIGEKIVKA